MAGSSMKENGTIPSLRKRQRDEIASSTATQDKDSEEESDVDVPGICASIKSLGAAVEVPTGTDTTPELLESVTKNMSRRWRNWTVRFIFGFLMLIGYIYLLSLGPVALALVVMCIEMKCFSEIINIGYVVYKSQNLPLFRSLSWYFLITANYLVFGESVISQFSLLLNKTELLRFLVSYHHFISFSLYVAGFVAFVCSLRKRYYVRQFTLFGYTHLTLLILAAGSSFLIRAVFEGLFWFFLSTSMIICNDIWAYFFGFFLGKTPLIKLSPKKTWEGYIGGGIATLIYAVIASNALVNYDEFVCPVEYNLRREELLGVGCTRNPVFTLTQYSLPHTVQSASTMIGVPVTTVNLYPITFHALFLATFASLIGPFGGFFASGFKRAFKIKDFGDIFPGHGGFMDRFDCQLLMGAFTYMYVSTFIRMPNPQKLLGSIFALPPTEQVSLLDRLCTDLEVKGLTNCSSLVIH